MNGPAIIQAKPCPCIAMIYKILAMVFLRRYKSRLESHIDGPWNSSVSCELDAVIKALEDLEALP